MDELIKAQIERRAKAWNEAKVLVTDAERDETTGDFARAEDKAKYERLNAEMQSAEERANELLTLAKRNADFDAQRADFEDIVRPKASEERGKPEDEHPLVKLCRGEIRSADINTQMSRHEMRDLTKGSASAGGDTVPTTFRNSLYEELIENSAVRQTRATVLSTSSGEDLVIPVADSYSTAAIVAEAAAIGESDPTFRKVTLGAFKYGLLMQISSELLADSGVNIAEFLGRQAGRAIGNATGAHFVTGDGSSKPNGIVTAATSGVTTTTGKAGVPQYEDYVDLFHSVAPPYRRNAEWMMSDTGLAEARKIVDADTRPLWQPGMATAEPSTILGKPYTVDPNVADPALNAKSLLFGDFSTYYIRDVGSVRLERSDDYAFANDLVSFRVLFRTDGDLVDTSGSIKFATGAAS